MYEELVKRLRDDEAWKNCDFDFIYGWMHEAADAIEELQKQRDEWESHATLAESFARGWIPVTERLPDESEPVLACVYWPDYTDNEICYGQYIKNGRFRLTHYVEGELIKGYEVKAWMPIPEPPKEGK